MSLRPLTTASDGLTAQGRPVERPSSVTTTNLFLYFEMSASLSVGLARRKEAASTASTTQAKIRFRILSAVYSNATLRATGRSADLEPRYFDFCALHAYLERDFAILPKPVVEVSDHSTSPEVEVMVAE